MVLGVPAYKYAKTKTLKTKIQRRSGFLNNAELVFNSKGRPVMDDISLPYIEFMNKNFMHEGYHHDTKEVNDLLLEDKSIFDFLYEYQLELFFDGDKIYSSDLIGMRIHSWNNDEEGISQEQLPELFIEAKKRLLAVGIDEQPKIYASFYHSY